MTTTTAKENLRRMYIKNLPDDHSDYGAWRCTLCAQMLRAAPDPLQIMRFLRDLDDENVSFADHLGLLDKSMNRVDVSMFAAVRAACLKKKAMII